MAKQDKVPAKTSGTDLAINDDSMEFLAGRAGQGMERVTMADIVMPRVSILQTLSPQLNSRKPEYVEGVKEGQLFNQATQRAVDNLRVVPCFYLRHHIEWLPNRGGFVADHGEAGAALLDQCTRNDQKYDVLPNGNLLVPTPTWYCLDLDNGAQQIVIPMPRTQGKASKAWMGMATSEVVKSAKHGDFKPPLFFRSYGLSSRLREEGENDWHVFNVERGPTCFELREEFPDLLTSAANFSDMLKSGEVKADASHFADEGQGVGGGAGSEGDDRPM